jgi:hypothetical protein
VWEVTVSLEAANRIEAYDFSNITEKKISVLNMFENDCMRDLVTNMNIAFNCIWCCIKPQAEAKGVTAEDFREAITGDIFEPGMEVWQRALADFSQRLKPLLLKFIEQDKKAQEAQSRAVKKVESQVDGMTDAEISRLERQLDEEMAKAKAEIAGTTSG